MPITTASHSSHDISKGFSEDWVEIGLPDKTKLDVKAVKTNKPVCTQQLLTERAAE